MMIQCLQDVRGDMKIKLTIVVLLVLWPVLLFAQSSCPDCDQVAWGSLMVGGGRPAVTPVQKDSQDTSDDFINLFNADTSHDWAGTSFTAGSSYTLTSFKLKVRKPTTPAGTVTGYVWGTAAGHTITASVDGVTFTSHGDNSQISFFTYGY